jgi:hypothetical protein
MPDGGKCPTCGLVFEANLRRHIKTHLSYEDRPHKVSLPLIIISAIVQCSYCDMRFIRKITLRIHLRRKHEIDLPYDQQNSHPIIEQNKNSPPAEKSRERKPRQSNRIQKLSLASKQTENSTDKKKRNVDVKMKGDGSLDVKRPLRTSSRNNVSELEGNRMCVVCQDRAFGKYYGVFSCEGCKVTYFSYY